MASYANGLPRNVRPPVPPPPPVVIDDDPYDVRKSNYKPRTDSLPPVVPPLPTSWNNEETSFSKPAPPPLPSNWSPEIESRFNDENILWADDGGISSEMVSPKPQRLPGGSTDAARRLEDAVTISAPGHLSPPMRQSAGSTYQSQAQPYYPGGFVLPGGPSPGRAPSPYAPGLPSSPHSARMAPSPSPIIPPPRMSSSISAGSLNSMTHQMQAMSFDSGRPDPSQGQHRRGRASTASSNVPLIAALPTPAGLQRAAPNEGTDPSIALSWIQSALLLSSLAPASELSARSTTGEPTIATILPRALRLLQEIANSPSPPPLAYFLRGTLLSSGIHPEYFQRSPRAAFKDYEKAARSGYDPAWFRLGRDYESVGDVTRAKDCFERGARSNERSCLYRMGMAHLLGQLNLPSNPPVAFPLLIRAASLATLEVPQPPYVLGMILLNELPSVSNLPVALLQTALPDNSVTLQQHALALIQKSAFLHFAPAQYKLGYAYENAQLGLPYDPTLSVRWYSFASQGDELEADMALSKWFLCGAEGYFDKDEGLARTFAEKAARRGLPSAEFAMGYYCEVGIGGPKNVEQARKWYTKAANHNNPDAPARLAALDNAQPQGLSRVDHETLTNSTLVRSRTQARERSQLEGRTATGSQKKEQEALAAARRASLIKSSRSFQGGLAAAQEQPSPLPDAGRSPALAPRASPSSAPVPLPESNSSSPGSSRPATRQGRKVSPGPRRESLAASQGPPAPAFTAPAPGTPAQASQPASFAPATPMHLPQPSASFTPVQTAHGRGYSLSETILPPTTNPTSAPSTPGSVPPKKGPATFEEMGFYSQPLDEQKCLIM